MPATDAKNTPAQEPVTAPEERTYIGFDVFIPLEGLKQAMGIIGMGSKEFKELKTLGTAKLKGEKEVYSAIAMAEALGGGLSPEKYEFGFATMHRSDKAAIAQMVKEAEIKVSDVELYRQDKSSVWSHSVDLKDGTYSVELAVRLRCPKLIALRDQVMRDFPSANLFTPERQDNKLENPKDVISLEIMRATVVPRYDGMSFAQSVNNAHARLKANNTM